MQNKIFLHSISPEKVIRGENAWLEGKQLISNICNKPILLGRSTQTSKLRNCLANDLFQIGVNVIQQQLEYDCCENDIERVYSNALKINCDGIVAAGGGKVLDAGKLIAQKLNVPCITIPLSASTCAGWTALSNIYSEKGAFIRDIVLNNCPNLLIFDYGFIRQAPQRTLASGIADALAKWYESSICNSNSDDALVQQALQMARVLRDQIIIDSHEAINDPQSKAWIRIIEGCSLTAGLIGGIGGSKCRTAAAHAIHNGLTQLEITPKPLHGELVGFGILVQLTIEEMCTNNQLACQAKKQLYQILEKLNLPTNLKSLGINIIEKHMLDDICKFICHPNSDIHNLPFKVNKSILMKSIIETDNRSMSINKNTRNHSAIERS